MRKYRIPFLATLAVAFGFAVGFVTLMPSGLVADDSSHMTALGASTFTFDIDNGAERAVVGTITSTDLADYKWTVSLFCTAPGGSERFLAESYANRATGETSGVTCAVQPTLVPVSGTVVRAYFQTHGQDGAQRFSLTRTYTVP